MREDCGAIRVKMTLKTNENGAKKEEVENVPSLSLCLSLSVSLSDSLCLFLRHYLSLFVSVCLLYVYINVCLCYVLFYV